MTIKELAMLTKTKLSVAVATVLATTSGAVYGDNVKDKGTATNVAFNQSFVPTEYSLKGKPNIILISVDDLGYGQLNYDDAQFNKEVLKDREVPERYQVALDKAIEAAKKSTPTLRSLQDNGVKLSQGFVAHGVSGPSRAAMMSSRFPARYGIYSNDDAQDGVSADETFLAELFQDYGYETSAIGKWHLCRITNVPVPKEKQTRDYHDNFTTYCDAPFQPQARGFDYFFGFHASGVSYYDSPSLFENRERTPAVGYVTDQFTDKAIERLKEAGDKPAFIYLAYNAPHIPLEQPAPKEYQIFNTGNSEVDNYYASVYAVDQGVKRILDELKKQGKDQNTLIFFTSDNGAVVDSPMPMNGVLKGYKGETQQGGVRTPMFASWPAQFKPQDYNKMVSATDFMVTALAAAEIPVPEDLSKKLDGVNLIPFIKGEDKGEPHPYLYWAQPRAFHWDPVNIPFWHNYFKYITSKSDDYPDNPYMEKLSKFTWTVRDKDWTLHYWIGDQKIELFKNSDVGELKEVSKDNPEVVKRLKAKMNEYLRTAQKPNTDNNVPKYEALLKATE
ncbi:sulfatase [Volucribacter amazonae]|uniref:Sulfatase n=2 Tax=Volucribacter amazonae TaxID=256731 RepID=A0A9X4PDM4_9PAST|nr:sulfatase [Volucribacter amazonae]